MNLMNSVFQDCLDKFVLVFLDDILIYSKNENKHYQHLQIVLKLLQDYKLYGKLSKCFFFQIEVQYLGHIISVKGMVEDPTMTMTILEWPTPRNV